MQPHRQVPQIGHQRPNISQGARQPIQPVMQPSEAMLETGVPASGTDELRHEIASEIYARLVIAYIERVYKYDERPTESGLKMMAEDAKAATEIYFQTMAGGEQS